MKGILLEALAIVAVGAVLALAANALSPRGLELGRDYFKQLAPPPDPRTISTNAAPHPTEREQLEARLRQRGLRLADKELAHQLFRDGNYEQAGVVFIDARDDQNYAQGHIPGACQFDYYRPANYLAAVLPACQSAAQIVVYCNGGNCEDSELAATFLQDAGVPGEKLLVYAGGFTEWQTNSWPVEIGPRHSGMLEENKK